MANITWGSGAPYTPPTLEAAAYLFAQQLAVLQRSPSSNPQSKDIVGITTNDVTDTVSISFSIPCTPTRNASGVTVYSVVQYFIGDVYVFKAGSTLVATHLLEAFKECIEFIQIKEFDTALNTTAVNNVSFSITSDGTNFSGSLVLDLTAIISTAGTVQYTAKSYLA